MAKASVVSAKQEALLREINRKLDLLLDNAGLTVKASAGEEAPKPIKTFVSAPPPAPAPAVEAEAVKPSRKRG